MPAANPDNNNVAKEVENLENYVREPKINLSRRLFLASNCPNILGYYNNRIQDFQQLMNNHKSGMVEHKVYQTIIGFWKNIY